MGRGKIFPRVERSPPPCGITFLTSSPEFSGSGRGSCGEAESSCLGMGDHEKNVRKDDSVSVLGRKSRQGKNIVLARTRLDKKQLFSDNDNSWQNILLRNCRHKKTLAFIRTVALSWKFYQPVKVHLMNLPGKKCKRFWHDPTQKFA